MFDLFNNLFTFLPTPLYIVCTSFFVIIAFWLLVKLFVWVYRLIFGK